MYMSTRTFCILSGIVSLTVGAGFYILCRENSYLSAFVGSAINVPAVEADPHIEFLSYYVPDFCWAFSLSGILSSVFCDKPKGAYICCMAAAAAGILWEFLQYIKFVSGTGDVVDAFLYILGGLTFLLIFKKRGLRK